MTIHAKMLVSGTVSDTNLVKDAVVPMSEGQLVDLKLIGWAREATDEEIAACEKAQTEPLAPALLPESAAETAPVEDAAPVEAAAPADAAPAPEPAPTA